MILEEQLLQKLKQLKTNNNSLIENIKKLELDTIETERRLIIMEKESADLLEFYSQISETLLEISSQLTYLKECSKKKAGTAVKSKNSSQKKGKKKISNIKQINELSLEKQSKKYKEIIIFLFNQFLNSQNPDDIADQEIEDEDQSLDCQEE